MDDISSPNHRKIAKPQNYPVENISLSRHGNESFRVGVSSMQGFRKEMEDAYLTVLQLPSHPQVGLFGIFDGHGSSRASRWFAEQLHSAVDRLPEFTSTCVTQMLLDLDQEYLSSTGDTSSGSTAIICIVEKNRESPESEKPMKVTVANIGDSRLYVGKRGTGEFLCLTKDHRPSDPGEKERITSAGGSVLRGRVDSLLSTSRSLGDHYYKNRKDLPPEKQKVIAVPDIYTTNLGPEDYLFLCCDGILEPQNFVTDGTGIFNFLFEKFRENSDGDSAEILSKLIQKLLQNGSKDNMTAMIVEFKNGENFNSGPEFIPGEFYGEYGNQSYLEAFTSDCERNGKTVDQVRHLWYSRNGREEEDKKKVNMERGGGGEN